MLYQDCTGRIIKVGDTVVVAQRRGSSQWLTQAKVVGSQVISTNQWAAIETPVLQWPEQRHLVHSKTSKPYKRKMVYRGSKNAIMVVKSPEDTNPDKDLFSFQNIRVNPFAANAGD